MSLSSVYMSSECPFSADYITFIKQSIALKECIQMFSYNILHTLTSCT